MMPIKQARAGESGSPGEPGAPGALPAGSAEFPLADLHRLLVESVRDYAIFAMDAGGHILSWNPGAERIKGYEAHEIIGRHFSVFYTDDAKAIDHPGYELKVAAAEGRYEEEGWRVRKDGSQFWANVTITAVRDHGGNLLGFAKVTRDLTERRAAHERAIEDAQRIAVAESANRAKAEFLTSLSHELRTPLNAIGGFVELILLGVRGDIGPQVRKDLERVQRSQQHLLGLINDLLNFSRIEAGHLTYVIVPFELAPLLDNVTAMLEPQAVRTGIELSVDPCPPGSMAVGDVPKVEQIMVNLLSNAVKFTPSGGSITVRCSVADVVSISVIDTGTGIPEGMLDNIFEPFVQLGRTLTSAHEGAGLGLSISRELARYMNGDLSATSVPGKGSVFTLTLPKA
ncbi:MAG TPA: ATP-binding protein [Longimicrobiales bacterium]|nr:ATP-binding protein [Longimicrobiales bacterium]